MILIEECTLRLDEPVNRLLPELADRQVLKRLDADLDDTVPAHRPITVRDLLTFRMGLGIVAAAPAPCPIADALAELELGSGHAEPADAARAGRVDPPPRHAAADVPARRALDVQHRLRCARAC